MKDAGRGTRIALLAAAGAMLVGAGVCFAVFDDQDAQNRVLPAQTRSLDPAPVLSAPTLSLSPRPSPSASAARGVPLRVAVKRLEIDVPVLPIAPEGGALTPPSNPRELGWYKLGALAGSARGSTVIAGHTVHTGGGALDELDDLRLGDTIRVRTSAGSITYRVSDVGILTKGQFARRAREVFSTTVFGRLVLITCTDWDGQEYRSNTVVYARPVS